MGRPKLCGNKLTCKLKDEHAGDCDYGLGGDKVVGTALAKDEVNEVDILKKKVAELTAQINRSTPDALNARVATAELELGRVHALVRETATGLQAAGLTVIAASLNTLLPSKEI